MSESYEIVITVDTNDADYITEVSEISQEDLERIRPLIEAIKNFEPYQAQTKGKLGYRHDHNYPCGDVLREDLGEKEPEEIYDFDEDIFDIFEDLLPSSQYGFHTITSIKVYPVPDKEVLL